MKSILHPLSVDETINAHNCQHNKRHRLVRGDKRLKFKVQRSHHHFCANCALRMIEKARARLDELEQQLR